ncbi:hypothetical protein C4D60_Mb04t27930 [Musa balbisiana]|uniref:t-SNARE coiled-coil homology domain-containing protein n=1 Tax=Musa balbisiana TaxID=52838 RepID=A0A4S8KF92_MUSBA|nr:hypothetical protein C4D60_Mb04t27930 [Musa balbisiana]
MSFQDLESGWPPTGRRDLTNGRQDSTQAVAAGLFQITTAVRNFERLVNTIGTPKDTPELRQKLCNTRLQIGQLVKDTCAKLEQVSETDHRLEVSANKKVADAKLARDFQHILKEFKNLQRLAAERETVYMPLVPQAANKKVADAKLARDFQHILKEFKNLQRLAAERETVYMPLVPQAANKKVADAKLARDFQHILKEFKNLQRLAAERETVYMPLVPQAVLPSSYAAIEADSNSNNTLEQRAVLAESRRQEVLLLDNEIIFNEAIIEEREQGIQEIQQQIDQVNEIFKDLAVLVHDQGVVIDDINTHIDNSHSATAQGKTQLKKAAKTQKSNSSLMCLLLVIFGIILLIVIIVIAA